MGFDRVGAKLAARESMRINKPSPLWVTLGYFLLTSVLAAAISYLVYSPLNDMLEYLTYGYEPMEIWAYILRGHGGELVVYGLVQVLWWVYTTFMGFGYTAYSLRMARNEQPGVGRLFDGFARPGRVLWAEILQSFFLLLWSLVILLPFMALMMVMAVAMAEVDEVVFFGLYFVMMFAIFAVVIVIAYRYSLTSYFIIDDPNCTARKAIRRSVETMRGLKMTLFTVDLSFFGWALLSMLLSSLISWFLPVAISNVLAFWLMPYRAATVANFYDWATGVNQPSGGGVGPEYDYGADNGPQPF